MDHVKARGVYTYFSIQESVKATGEGPVGVKWVGTNNGDEVVESYRSRLVAQEFRKKKEEALFAATPPFESLRTLIGIVASSGWQPEADIEEEDDHVHFYAPSSRRVFVQLLPEDPRYGEFGRCREIG